MPEAEDSIAFPAAADATVGLAELSYEQARDELLEVVRQLETGGSSLAESLTLWERGEALAARCQAWLDGARSRLQAAAAGSTEGESVD